MIYAISKFLCYVALRLFFRLRVRGRENFPSAGGFILAGNHVSFLDPVVFGAPCPRGLYYMARDTLFGRPFFGWFLRRIHAFPLKRRAADF
ncbi:MAG: lysophospholipid acyltransferase family protein, partial [Deltaproteobacteria bacterium]